MLNFLKPFKLKKKWNVCDDDLNNTLVRISFLQMVEQQQCNDKSITKLSELFALPYKECI